MAINDDARECVEAAKPSESTDTKAAHDQVGSVLVPWATACEKGCAHLILNDAASVHHARCLIDGNSMTPRTAGLGASASGRLHQ